MLKSGRRHIRRIYGCLFRCQNLKTVQVSDRNCKSYVGGNLKYMFIMSCSDRTTHNILEICLISRHSQNLTHAPRFEKYMNITQPTFQKFVQSWVSFQLIIQICLLCRKAGIITILAVSNHDFYVDFSIEILPLVLYIGPGSNILYFSIKI